MSQQALPGPVRWDGAAPFPQAAQTELAKDEQRRTLRRVTTSIREKRAQVVEERDDWETLRLAGEAIKTRTLRHLDTYLLQAEESLQAAGVTVHWARDAVEACQVVADLSEASGTREVVKIKSMATDEIGLNEFLAQRDIAAVETDLAELIVQLSGERSSHILVPAIHKSRRQIRTLFRRRLPGAPRDLSDDPAELAGEARRYLRETFLGARTAITGANFLVAETGSIVIVESEGNGRMCLTLADTMISVVGIEKVIPTWRDLEVYLQLLPRSSTGERMNPYTSVWTGVTPGDGPQEQHVVLVDNGRTDVLADEVGRQALRCIRCSACLNVCPVYERTGGHAYGSTYPGPIGAILTPQMRGMNDPVDRSLPFASTLCGACYEVCPVRINIPEVLVHLRRKAVETDRELGEHGLERVVFGVTEKVMDDDHAYDAALSAAVPAAHAVTPRDGVRWAPGPGRAWTRYRRIPRPPRRSFRAWWRGGRG
jgi:L-lactate dehydrogenase complex protein LldF